MNELTVLTLFGGRWHSLEPFLHGLTNLDWPIKGLKLLWYSNAEKRFIACLNWQKKILSRRGYRIDLIHDASLPPAERLFHDGDLRSGEHLNTIASLYNAAWQYVATDDVLLLEDDVLAPSHCLRRLVKVLDEKPKAAITASCVFDRHHDGVVFIWDVVYGSVDGTEKMAYRLIPVGQPWGVRKVSAAGFSCTLIRKSRLPDTLKKGYPFRVTNPIEGQQHIGGCDLVFCLQAQTYGREVYADFDVRPLHIDSQARIH